MMILGKEKKLEQTTPIHRPFLAQLHQQLSESKRLANKYLKSLQSMQTPEEDGYMSNKILDLEDFKLRIDNSLKQLSPYIRPIKED